MKVNSAWNSEQYSELIGGYRRTGQQFVERVALSRSLMSIAEDDQLYRSRPQSDQQSIRTTKVEADYLVPWIQCRETRQHVVNRIA